jgi:hypothetical protein
VDSHVFVQVELHVVTQFPVHDVLQPSLQLDEHESWHPELQALVQELEQFSLQFSLHVDVHAVSQDPPHAAVQLPEHPEPQVDSHEVAQAPRHNPVHALLQDVVFLVYDSIPN